MKDSIFEFEHFSLKSSTYTDKNSCDGSTNIPSPGVPSLRFHPIFVRITILPDDGCRHVHQEEDKNINVVQVCRRSSDSSRLGAASFASPAIPEKLYVAICEAAATCSVKTVWNHGHIYVFSKSAFTHLQPGRRQSRRTGKRPRASHPPESVIAPSVFL